MVKKKYRPKSAATSRPELVQDTFWPETPVGEEKPLHVMMNSKDLERYKALAAERRMTLRELVREALEHSFAGYLAMKSGAIAEIAEGADLIAHNPDGTATLVQAKGFSGGGAAGLERRVLELTERLSRLEGRAGRMLGGSFTAQVMELAYKRAQENGDLAQDAWLERRHKYVNAAYDDILRYYAEPLRSELAADRERFLATVLAAPMPRGFA